MDVVKAASAIGPAAAALDASEREHDGLIAVLRLKVDAATADRVVANQQLAQATTNMTKSGESELQRARWIKVGNGALFAVAAWATIAGLLMLTGRRRTPVIHRWAVLGGGLLGLVVVLLVVNIGWVASAAAGVGLVRGALRTRPEQGRTGVRKCVSWAQRYPWRSVAVAGGAMPQSISHLPTHAPTAVRRWDLQLWKRVADLGVLYADYGIAHPGMAGPRWRPMPSPRYTDDEVWWIYRWPQDPIGRRGRRRTMTGTCRRGRGRDTEFGIRRRRGPWRGYGRLGSPRRQSGAGWHRGCGRGGWCVR